MGRSVSSHSSASASSSSPSYQRCELVMPNNDNSSIKLDGKGSRHAPIDKTKMYDGRPKNDDDNDDDMSSSQSSSVRSSHRTFYNWRLYVPSSSSTTGQWCKFVRWFIVGGGAFAAPQSDEALTRSLAGLARCLILLRKYLAMYGMPTKGGIRDQEYVLREVMRDLYAGGAPLWALNPVMQKAAEGLTGQNNVNWQLFPRKAMIYSPSAGTTSMFKMERGFDILKMDNMEKVAVRLATFASNVEAVSNVPERFPHPREFLKAARTESVRNLSEPKIYEKNKKKDPKKLAKQILKLASKEQGLFYYINSRAYGGNDQFKADDDDDDLDDYDLVVDDVEADVEVDVDGHRPVVSTAETTTMTSDQQQQPKQRPGLGDQPQQQQQQQQRPGMLADFWVVSEEERELFSRLACLEAMRAIDEIDKVAKDPSTKQNPWLIIGYRVCASAGACAFWFRGSWWDMIVAGFLAVIVAFIGTSSFLSKQERIIYEVVASFGVGLTAALIAFTWPNDTCFASMAIAGVLDILQGFRVVYAIIEIMSKHTVAGTADLFEGMLFTGLIAYSLRFGQSVAAAILGNQDLAVIVSCENGIDELWYLLFVPLAAISWSGLFNPVSNRDLFIMGLHGVLAYGVNFGLSKAGANNELNNFVSASSVTLCAGILSRFTGRQAVGNTVAGMYVLLPGAYLVKSLYSSTIDGSFFTDIIQMAVIIGIGGWTGSILCSPTLLGTTHGLLTQQQGYHASLRGGKNSNRHDRGGKSRDEDNAPQPATMLYF